MAEALLIIQIITAATVAGMNILPLLEKVSALLKTRHAEGGTITPEDLKALFDEGDLIEAAALAQFEETLADPDTPPRT